VALITAIVVQMLLDVVDAVAKRRPVRFLGGWAQFVNFLPPAIIPALACAMLLYPNDRLMPVIFATALSIGSKVLFRAPVGNGRTQHIFNPSNLGIAVTLLLFPWVGFAPPYHFTKNLIGVWHWIVPGVVLLSGIVIHALFTGRLPLCLAWVGGFLAQGLLRSWIFDTPFVAPLVPMTSAAFIVFTLYMIPDPATTPIKPWRQVIFGLAAAVVYGILQVCHVVFGLFFALAIVSALRGVGLYLLPGWERWRGVARIPSVSSALTRGPHVAAGVQGNAG
jgi:Na+-translocating ferredoxin:NAD+ oxidoreductase RnfD subunit